MLEEFCMNCMQGTITGGRCSACGAEQLNMQMVTMALPLRTILHERYIIGKAIGQGGFGITYVAYDIREQRRVAIKEFYLSACASRSRDGKSVASHDNEEFFLKSRERFADEAKIIYKFRAVEEIVDVYHIFRENNTVYYVMEYLVGTDLNGYIKKAGGRLGSTDIGIFGSFSQFADILRDLLNALDILHKTGIFHRDISPDNIFIVSNNGRIKAKLIDFGAARSFTGKGNITMIMKRGYSPPEQYTNNLPKGPWSDLYSLCATIYFCLTGTRIPDALDRQRHDTTVSIKNLCSISEKGSRAVMKGLELDSRNRYMSAAALYNDLDLYTAAEDSAQRNYTGEYWGLRFLSGEAYVHGGIVNSGSGYVNSRMNEVIIGRDANRCNLVYSANAVGISRVHMVIGADRTNRYLYMICESMSQKIYVNDVEYSTQNKFCLLNDGDVIRFGQGQAIRVEKRKY